MTQPEAAARGGQSPRHIVQLFDSNESRAEAVAAFVREGLARGDNVLVVMRLEQWNLTAARLRREDPGLSEAIASGQLTVHDADATLGRFMRNGVPDAALFERSVGALVRQLASRPAGLRIYGEMVDILAAGDELEAACELEEMWNGLAEQAPFVLLCGYAAAHFASPRTAARLQTICRSHSCIRSNADDMLGTYLLEAHGASSST